jgi:ribonuclease P protein component
MLPRSNRLTNRRDIISTLRRGRCLKTTFVSIHLLARPDQKSARLAVIVAKTVDSSAVRRHRYQRWLRAAARELLPTRKQACDMVWVAKPPIARLAGSKELTERIRPLFDKLV